MLAEISQHGRDFVVRCSGASFAIARQMLKGEGPDSQIVTLTPCEEQAPLIRQQGLPQLLNVRFVRVRLSTGEDEVLVTSLLDENRLALENFTTALVVLKPSDKTFTYRLFIRRGVAVDRCSTSPARCQVHEISTDGQSSGVVQCDQKSRIGFVVERQGHRCAVGKTNSVISNQPMS